MNKILFLLFKAGWQPIAYPRLALLLELISERFLRMYENKKKINNF